MKDFLYTYKI